MAEEYQFLSAGPEETEAWAAEWASHLADGTVIALKGDLGAGKTCFVRGMVRGLGISSAVHSPTFTLINEYKGRANLYHLDLYRLSGADEALEIGIDQYLPGDGVTAIEWAERISSLLPPGTITVELSYGEDINQRIIRIIHGGES